MNLDDFPLQIANIAMEMLNGEENGFALCDPSGAMLYCNDSYQKLALSDTKMLIAQSVDLAIVSFDVKTDESAIRVKITKLNSGYAVTTSAAVSSFNARELTLENLSSVDSDNIFDSVVKNLYETTAWRWIAVSRFIEEEKIEILSMYDGGKFVDGYIYTALGTPCEVVASTKEFAFFPKLSERFPHYDVMHEMGAKVYAGMVYRSDSVPVGHIFAMHDEENVNATIIEDVLRLSVSIMGFKLEADHAKSAALKSEQEANKDSLTQVFNRRAFERDLATSFDYLEKKMFSDTILAIIDLDGMKNVNDTYGHDSGDTLLKTFAQAIESFSRPEDKLYRLGGDEFAMILNGAGPAQINSIQARIEKAVDKTRKSGFPTIGASQGFTGLSEVEGDITDWKRSADKRMYSHKRSKLKPS